MEELELALKIKDDIKNSFLYKDLKEKEKMMLEDELTFILLSKYQEKQEEYNQSLKYEKYGSNPDKVRKELADLKLEVDRNSFVVAYKKSYQELFDLLNKLNKTILGGIISENCKW